MADRFIDFVTELCEDPEKLEKFKKDPETVLEESGLSAAERVLVKSGNRRLIHAALGGALPSNVVVVTTENVVVVRNVQVVVVQAFTT